MSVVVGRDELLRAHVERVGQRPAGSEEQRAAIRDLVQAWRLWPLHAAQAELAALDRIVGDREARRRLMGRLIEALELCAEAECVDLDRQRDEALEVLRATSHLVTPREVPCAA